MKFSAPEWCFRSESKDPGAFFEDLKAIGYDGVEMVGDAADRKRARDCGLDVVNLSGPGMVKGLNRLEHHDELIPKIRDLIERAGQEHIPHVIVFSGNRDGQPDDEGLENCRRGLELLIPFAELAGVTLVLEMLNSHNHRDYQADYSSYGFRLVEALNSPHIRTLFDLYHMTRMGEQCEETLIPTIEKVAHLHFAEPPDRTMPRATGGLALERMIPAILKTGYNGYWGMEFQPGKGATLEELRMARDLFLSIGERASP
jgi:hydroxypyruvate isomerase